MDTTPDGANREESFAEYESGMAALVDAGGVKDAITTLHGTTSVRQERVSRGLLTDNAPKTGSRNNVVAIVGPPGTGKTLLARLITSMWAGFGKVNIPKMRVVDRHDLVAGYEGQTASKVVDAVSTSLGGVLVIEVDGFTPAVTWTRSAEKPCQNS
jgi:stage V sporulation protein K